MSINDFEIDSKLLFAKYNLLIFCNKNTQEYNEILAIISNNNFNKFFTASSINDALEIVSKNQISIVFFDMYTIEYLNTLKDSMLNKNYKFISIVDNINSQS